MTKNVNWQENTNFDYSDNFDIVILKFTDDGFYFEFHDEGKCDSETLEVKFDGDKMIVVKQTGTGSYGVFTTDMIPANLTRAETNKYMTKLAAGWIVEFAKYHLEQK